MNKLKLKVIGATFNPSDKTTITSLSTSAYNIPKYVEWIPNSWNEDADFTIYADWELIQATARSGKKYGWLFESRGYTQPIIDKILEHRDIFNEHYYYIFTPLADLVALGHPFAYTIPNCAPWIMQDKRKIYTKSKNMSMLVSDNYFMPGHKYRVDYMNANRQHFDLYGRGYNYIENVEDAMIDYRFVVSMENVPDDFSFSERLTNPMVVGSVPVYWGSRGSVGKYFDKEGVLFAEDVNLADLNEEVYSSMLPHIKNNFEIAAYDFPIAEDYIAQHYLLK